ncbi:MAG: ABC transporter permease [Peptococcaceae bacterium]
MKLIKLYQQYQFVFIELVKRDFKKKYKRSFLGVLWSMLAPLFTLLIMNFMFSHFFGRIQEYYTIYLFSGWLIFQYYNEATNGAMNSLMANSGIFSKVKVPKYLFLFSRIASSSINFFLTLVIYFIFVLVYGLPITWKFITLLFPIACMFLLILGIGLILSALFVFFRDVQYLYGVFTTALMYATPIFYTTDIMGDKAWIFYLNPLYYYVTYFRSVVIDGVIPSLAYHGVMLGVSLLLFAIGCWMYKKYNYKFLYYV